MTEKTIERGVDRATSPRRGAALSSVVALAAALTLGAAGAQAQDAFAPAGASIAGENQGLVQTGERLAAAVAALDGNEALAQGERDEVDAFVADLEGVEQEYQNELAIARARFVDGSLTYEAFQAQVQSIERTYEDGLTQMQSRLTADIAPIASRAQTIGAISRDALVAVDVARTAPIVASQTPVVETPVVQAPIVQTPVVQAPLVQAPIDDVAGTSPSFATVDRATGTFGGDVGAGSSSSSTPDVGLVENEKSGSNQQPGASNPGGNLSPAGG